MDLAANNSQVLRPIFPDRTREEDVISIAKMVSMETNKLDLVISWVGYLHNAEHGPEKILGI